MARAALIAAIAQTVLAVYYGIEEIRFATPLYILLSIVLGSMVPSAVWAAFFFILYRQRSGLATTPISLRTAVWITLAFGIGFEVLFVLIRMEMSVIYWTPLGHARRLMGWALRFGWALLLPSLVLAPDRAWTRRIAGALLILSAPSTLTAMYDAVWNNPGELFRSDFPVRALWRVGIVPLIRIFYWISQMLFLWTIARNPASLRSPDSILRAV